jgi:glycosyltransferase involved in cell wall biosynthesis
MASSGSQRFLYLFKAGRRERLSAPDKFPSDFFYGYVELLAGGYPVDYLDERDLAPEGRATFFSRLAARLAARFAPRLPFALGYCFVLGRFQARRRLNQSRALIATTNTFGYCLAILRRLGLIRVPVYFIAMGAIPLELSGWQRRVLRWLLGATRLVVISEGERGELSRELPGQPIHLLPFGVDETFWTPGPCEPSSPFALAIGNDRHRDWAALVAAWHPEFPQLKILTSLPVPGSAANIEVVRADWRHQHLSDAQIRNLVRQALFVILPLRQTVQPSGQSVCLQAMSCAKAVILSSILGLWDRQALRHEETCLLVPPSDAGALTLAVRRLLGDESLRRNIGEAARQEIVSRLNAQGMSQQMRRILEDDA